MALLKFFYYLGSVIVSSIMAIGVIEEDKKVKIVMAVFACGLFVSLSFVLENSMASLIGCLISIGVLIAYKRNMKLLISLFISLELISIFNFFIDDFLMIHQAADEFFYLYSYFFVLSILAILLLICRKLDFSYLLFVNEKIEILKYCGMELLFLTCSLLLLKGFVNTDVFSFIVKYFCVVLLTTSNICLMVIYNLYQSEKILFTKEVEDKQEANAYMNIIRSQRHDYNLHVQTIASLAKQEKWDDCRSYVNALVDDTNVMNKVLPVENIAIAALINNYRIMCLQQGFELEIDIRDDLSSLLTNEYESNKIIGNLLQNAYDETQKLKDKSYGVKLDIFKKGEFALIKVSNKVADASKFSENKEEIFKQGFTTKTGHDGVGLSSISMVLKKYNGEIYSWLENDIVHFVANIPISLQ